MATPQTYTSTYVITIQICIQHCQLVLLLRVVPAHVVMVSKKESKIFTLRNIDTAITASLSILEGVIREQLGDDICLGSFDMGYLRGSNTVTLRNKEDIIEVWANIKNGKNIM